MAKQLTALQKLFVKYFDGTAASTAKAMRKDGIEVAQGTIEGYATDPKIIEAIRNRETDEPGRIKKKGIADRKARQTFWTETMVDEEIDMKHRLKASELLGRSEKDFTEKVEVKNENPLLIAHTVVPVELEERIKLILDEELANALQ